MLEDNPKSVLDKPSILRREAIVREPVKKGKRWVFKIILILAVIFVLYYLFSHPEVIQEPVNNFFGNLLD